MSRNGSDVLEVRIRIVGRGHVFRLRRCRPLLSSSSEAPGWYPVFHPLKRDIPLPQLRPASELEDRLIDNRGKEPDGEKKEPAPLHLKDEVRTDSEEKRTELRSVGHVPPAGAARLPAGMAPNTPLASSRNVRTPRQAAKLLRCWKHHRGHLAERRSRNMSHRPLAKCDSLQRIQHRQSKRARPTPSAKMELERTLRKRYELRPGWCVPPAGAQ